MKRIALTGGIGSGKSVVARIFKLSCRADIYDSDSHAKELMESDKQLTDAIKAEFGEAIYTCGKLNRTALAECVFGNEMALAKLNSLVHPAVMCDFKRWANNLTHTDFAIMESAIIIDNNLQSHFDLIIAVSAPLEMRIERAMRRDGATREAIQARITAQISDSEREQKADYVIINDEQHSLWEQVVHINQKLAQVSRMQN